MLHPEEYKVEHGMLATNEQFGSGAEKKISLLHSVITTVFILQTKL